MEIRGSARKHGATDEDIRHAIEHALVIAELDAEKELHLGPDPVGRFLEIVIVKRDAQEPVMIHAMTMRRQYEPYLRGLEGGDDR